MNALLNTLIAPPEDLEQLPTDPCACSLLAPSVCTNLIEQPESMAFTALFAVEPAGIEPATSCLQRASSRDLLRARCRFGLC